MSHMKILDQLVPHGIRFIIYPLPDLEGPNSTYNNFNVKPNRDVQAVRSRRRQTIINLMSDLVCGAERELVNFATMVSFELRTNPSTIAGKITNYDEQLQVAVAKKICVYEMVDALVRSEYRHLMRGLMQKFVTAKFVPMPDSFTMGDAVKDQLIIWLRKTVQPAFEHENIHLVSKIRRKMSTLFCFQFSATDSASALHCERNGPGASNAAGDGASALDCERNKHGASNAAGASAGIGGGTYADDDADDDDEGWTEMTCTPNFLLPQPAASSAAASAAAASASQKPTFASSPMTASMVLAATSASARGQNLSQCPPNEPYQPLDSHQREPIPAALMTPPRPTDGDTLLCVDINDDLLFEEGYRVVSNTMQQAFDQQFESLLGRIEADDISGGNQPADSGTLGHNPYHLSLNHGSPSHGQSSHGSSSHGSHSPGLPPQAEDDDEDDDEYYKARPSIFSAIVMAAAFSAPMLAANEARDTTSAAALATASGSTLASTSPAPVAADSADVTGNAPLPSKRPPRLED